MLTGYLYCFIVYRSVLYLFPTGPTYPLLPLLSAWIFYFYSGIGLEVMIRFGGWDKYLIRERFPEMKCFRTAWPVYKRQLLLSARDLFVLLPTAYALLYPWVILTDPSKIEEYYAWPVYYFLKLNFGVLLGYLLRMCVHRAFHTPSLYRFHRGHHVPLRHLTPFVCYTDSVLENILMEVLGGNMLPLLICPSPAPVAALLWCYHVWTGLVDHSVLHVPVCPVMSYLFDSRYHYLHHLFPTQNFAEFEILDRLCGSYTGPEEKYD